jgi:hypothetical protein
MHGLALIAFRAGALPLVSSHALLLFNFTGNGR